MAIINIETSGKTCSAALTHEGVLEMQLDDSTGMQHAVKLAPFTEQLLDEAHRKELPIEAVAVSMGPGSYTGLRIGLSLAKGLAYSLDVPLIGVDTLKILAVKAMFRTMDWQGDEILVPMVDARRMEVFTGAFDFSLQPLMEEGAMVLDPNSYAPLLETGRPVWLMGNGASKAKEVLSHPALHWIEGLEPQAKDMLALSEKALREGDFIDKAYSVPHYLKEYQTTTPKNKVLVRK